LAGLQRTTDDADLRDAIAKDAARRETRKGKGKR